MLPDTICDENIENTFVANIDQEVLSSYTTGWRCWQDSTVKYSLACKLISKILELKGIAVCLKRG